MPSAGRLVREQYARPGELRRELSRIVGGLRRVCYSESVDAGVVCAVRKATYENDLRHASTFYQRVG